MSVLFRAEALTHKQTQWMGTIRVAAPVPFLVLVVLLCVAMGLLLGFAATAQFPRKVPVAGYVVPDRGILKINAPRSGVVTEVRVITGQEVRRGDVLFTISVGATTTEGDAGLLTRDSLLARHASLAKTTKLDHELARERVAALRIQIDHMQRQRDQLDSEIFLVGQSLEVKEREVEEYESLIAEGFFSAAHARAKRAEAIELRARISGLSARRIAQVAETTALESRLKQMSLEQYVATESLSRDTLIVEEALHENLASHAIAIRAHEEGSVASVLVKPGQSVSQESALIHIVPTGARLQVELFGPSSAIGMIKIGQAVRLRYEAFPYQSFGHHLGTVKEVSAAPLRLPDSDVLPLVPGKRANAASELPFKISVDLPDSRIGGNGELHKLIVGMRVDAEVVLESRSLLQKALSSLMRGRSDERQRNAAAT